MFQTKLSGAPSCLALDALDSFALVGTNEGPILRVDLDAWAHALTKREEPSLNIATYDGHAQKVVGVVASNETQFVSASSDGTLRVWDVAARHSSPLSRAASPFPATRSPSSSSSGSGALSSTKAKLLLLKY